MKTQKQLKEYIAGHPGMKLHHMAHNLSRHGVTVPMMKAAMEAGTELEQPSRPPRSIGQPLSQLIDQFDDVSKAAKAMKALPKDSYLDDDEMRRSCGVNPDRWKAVCQHPTLVPFRFALPRGNKHVWMHQAAQAKLTAAINLDQS